MTVTVRAMLPADLPAASAVGAAGMGFELGGAEEERRWSERIGYLLGPDPGGAFVAERDGRVIGVAQSMQREALWVLSVLAVDPGAHGAGAGRALLAATLGYGDPRQGLIVSSDHPAAMRLYAAAGFSLRPALRTLGQVDRRALPPHSASVRAGTSADLDLAAEISHELRGAAHTAEIQYALSRGAELLVCGERGYAVAQDGYGVWLLAARDEAAATELLWRALDVGAAAERPVRWITAGQDWAVAVVLGAGLGLTGHGALCVRGDPGPLAPYLPSAPFA
ncbi:MAG: GNAT family N-acetyltransferase [Actinomycetota bacterium]|nr:GNAT family N-acetyltransferase [Actinomycetota bacterium]